MRYLFLLLLLIPLSISGQDKKVTALPADTVVQGTDLLYVIDQATTSKKMTMTRILNVMNDTANSIREELGDSITVIRGEITGAAGWTKTGNDVHFTDANDSLSIGTATNAAAKLLVNGNIKATDNISTQDTVKLIGPYNVSSGKLYSSGDNLMLYDDNSGAVSLSSLMGGSLFSLSGTTRYPTTTTDNWNFGASATTTYKLKVTGDFGTTGIFYLGSNSSMEDFSTTGLRLNLPNSKSMWMTSRALSTGYASNLTSSGLSVNEVSYLPSVPSSGDMFNKSGSLLFYDGAEWDTLNPVNTLAGGLEIIMDECADCDTAMVAHGKDIAYRLISSFEGGSGTGTLKGTMAATRIPFGVDSDSLTTSTNFIYADSMVRVDILRQVNDYAFLRLYNDISSGAISATIGATDGSQSASIISSASTGYTYSYNQIQSDSNIIIGNSGTRVEGTIIFGDSTYFNQFVGDADVWLTLTSTGAVDTAHTTDAGFMLTLSPFPSIKEYMTDMQGGEISWLYKDKKGIIQKSYGLPKKPVYAVQALQGGIERAYMFTLEHDKRIETLESELRKLQKDYDELKRSYGDRLSNMEQVMIKKLAQ